MPRMTGSGRRSSQQATPTTSPTARLLIATRAKETAHPESHLAKDVDDQLVVRLREEIDGERLETVAAHQPQKADDEHEDEVDDDAEDRPADGEEDIPRRVDDRAHLLGDVDVEVKLLSRCPVNQLRKSFWYVGKLVASDDASLTIGCTSSSTMIAMNARTAM